MRTAVGREEWAEPALHAGINYAVPINVSVYSERLGGECPPSETPLQALEYSFTAVDTVVSCRCTLDSKALRYTFQTARGRSTARIRPVCADIETALCVNTETGYFVSLQKLHTLCQHRNCMLWVNTETVHFVSTQRLRTLCQQRLHTLCQQRLHTLCQ